MVVAGGPGSGLWLCATPPDALGRPPAPAELLPAALSGLVVSWEQVFFVPESTSLTYSAVGESKRQAAGTGLGAHSRVPAFGQPV